MIGYVAGEVSLWPKLTGEETLHFLERLHGTTDAVYRTHLVERFQLDTAKRVRAYSKGNRQKLAIIAALSSRAPILLLDEPTAGLDPLMERVFRQSVTEAIGDGRSVLLSSHELSEVEHLCNRVVMIRSGKIIESAEVADLRRRAHAVYDIVGDLGDLGQVPGVVSVEPIEGGVRVNVAGAPGPLLAVLATREVRSIVSREASLEEIFLASYDESGPRPT
jgi:ABC-2 type transport system ATP-binding protein